MKNPKELISEYIELLNSDISEGPVFTGAENIFIAEAKKYTDSQGWTYAYTAFKNLGISEEILQKAGFKNDGFEALENELNEKLDRISADEVNN